MAHYEGVKFVAPAIEMPKNWERFYKQWKGEEITAVQFMEAMGMKKQHFIAK